MKASGTNQSVATERAVWAGALLAVAAILGGLLKAAMTRAQVVGDSMAPTYRHGQPIWVIRRPWTRLRAGDVLVFHNPRPLPPPFLVKRLIGTPNDRELPAGQIVSSSDLWVAGDNPVSLGSEQLGPVERHSVLGVVRPRTPTPH